MLVSTRLPDIELHTVRVSLSPKELRDSVAAFDALASTGTAGRHIGKGDLITDPEPQTVRVELKVPAGSITAKFEVCIVSSTAFGAHTVLLRASSVSREELGALLGRKPTAGSGFHFYILAIDIKLHNNDQGDHIILPYVSSIADNGRESVNPKTPACTTH